MVLVSIEQAQAELEELIARVEAGEEVTLTRDGAPAVRLELVAPVGRPGASGSDAD